MRWRTASRIRKMGPSNWRIRVAGRKTPALSTITGQIDPSLVLGERSRVGCGGGPPHIVYSQNGALELADASRRAQGTRIEYGRRTGWPLLGAWRPE
jgi:hypothetical protein